MLRWAFHSKEQKVPYKWLVLSREIFSWDDPVEGAGREGEGMHSSERKRGRWCATELRKCRIKLSETAKQPPVPWKSSSSKKIQIW